MTLQDKSTSLQIYSRDVCPVNASNDASTGERAFTVTIDSGDICPGAGLVVEHILQSPPSWYAALI